MVSKVPGLASGRPWRVAVMGVGASKVSEARAGSPSSRAALWSGLRPSCHKRAAPSVRARTRLLRWFISSIRVEVMVSEAAAATPTARMLVARVSSTSEYPA